MMASMFSLTDPKTWNLTVDDVAKADADGVALLSPTKAAKAILEKIPIAFVESKYVDKPRSLKLWKGIWSVDGKPEDRVQVIIFLILDELVGDSLTESRFEEVMRRIRHRLIIQDPSERVLKCVEIAKAVEKILEG